MRIKKKDYFKKYSYITDGKYVIFIGSVRLPTWSLSNTHGSKEVEYKCCAAYPHKLRIRGILAV